MRYVSQLALAALAALATFWAADAAAQAPAAAGARAATPPALVVRVQNRSAASEAARGAARRDTAVRAGDALRYTLSFTNTTSRPVRNVTLANPLPAQLAFVGGSASASRADARAEYSADAGKSWAPRPTESVVVDGKRVTRPVPPERYTNVRWTLREPVAAGATVTAHYDARLAAPAAGRATAGR
jgi:uncharacterized repeat protein (TIGR01451 family)